MSESCPACGEQTLRPWRRATSPDEDAVPFPLLACSSCGSAALATPPPAAEGPRLYEGRPSRRAIVERGRRLVVRERLRFLRGVQGRRVLEVGAGDAMFLALLNDRGWEVTGVEPYREPAPAARDAGIVVETVPVEQLDVGDHRYDLVVLWHVLEHLPEPADVLTASRRWLEEDGALLLAVPNLASLQARLGGDRWFHQDVPRHVVHFTPQGLEQLLRRCGFEIRRRFRFVIDQNGFGMWQTLLNRITREPNVAYRLLGGAAFSRRRPPIADAVVTAVAAVPALVAAAALEPLASAARLGGTIVLVARPGEVAGA